MRKVCRAVCRLADLEEGVGSVYPLSSERDCTLFKMGGTVYATGSLCPHQNSSLHGAPIIEGEIVCRTHGYRFHPKTGNCLTLAGFGIQTYPVDIVNDEVRVSYWEYEDET